MDLNVLSLSVNRLLTNIGNIISFLKEYTVGTAKDVSITHINPDGSEVVKTFPNIAKQMAGLEVWKTDFSSNAVFTAGPGMQGHVVKKVGTVRIDDSSAYFNTGIDIGETHTGFSLSANILYERNDGDAANTCMVGYAKGYVGAEEVTTSLFGDPDIKCKVDADGLIWVANITPPASNQAYLVYSIEYITL